jgi:hypothetical protein
MTGTKPKPVKLKLTTEVEPEVGQSLAQWADEEDRSVSAQIRRLIVQGLQSRRHQEAA